MSEQLTPQELQIIAAYKLALSMIGDLSHYKLHQLLDILECRDLLRKQRLIEGRVKL